MSARWHALFVPLEDAAHVEAALRAALADLGYQPYDPFPGGSGTPPGLIALVRSFVAPPQEGWTRVLGELDDTALPTLSAALPDGGGDDNRVQLRVVEQVLEAAGRGHLGIQTAHVREPRFTGVANDFQMAIRRLTQVPNQVGPPIAAPHHACPNDLFRCFHSLMIELI